MVRNKKDSFFENMFSNIFSFIPELISALLKDSIENMINEFYKGIKKIQKNFELRIYFFMLMIASIVLFSISAVMLMEQYLMLSRAFSFMVLALTYVIAMIVIKFKIE